MHEDSGDLNASELLSIAFGRAENDGDTESIESQNAGPNLFCIYDTSEIHICEERRWWGEQLTASALHFRFAGILLDIRCRTETTMGGAL